MSLADLLTYENLGNVELPPLAPKATSLDGQSESAVVLWESHDSKVQMGVWECTPGRFDTQHKDNSEICHIIEGEVELLRNDGEACRLGPGDALVLPRGWTGQWNVIKHVRKMWVVQYD
ncbi:cupin domain-containing protein [Shinella granuli]|uniref:(S)-ureidoglycine aminohydrolase cupin domain-containing protein n=1 Tax=Shinella granuli TaxID=323621 RepID=A0A4R2C2A9_SHIGR|nr:cupin domain-containing protein [Shinella granuli]TCN34346.1 hypothetical protein EV665_1367 [Shinella granuli]